VLDGGIGLGCDLGIAPIAFQRCGRNAARIRHRFHACQSLLGRITVGTRCGKLTGDLGAARRELTQPAVLEGAQLIGKLCVHRGHVGDAGGNAGALALKLVDEAGEIIQPGAFRTPVDDAQDGVSGGKVRPDVDAGRRFDLAFNGGAQRNQLRSEPPADQVSAWAAPPMPRLVNPS
jgi:hypothetical protein